MKATSHVFGMENRQIGNMPAPRGNSEGCGHSEAYDRDCSQPPYTIEYLLGTIKGLVVIMAESLISATNA